MSVRLQGHREDVADVVRVEELETLTLLLGDLLDVPLVAVGDDDLLDPGPLRRERLLLQPTDRQDLARQRDLAGHRDVVADGPARDPGGGGGRRRDPGREAVLGAQRYRSVD